MNNKQLGNEFEAEFCQMLYNRGFWVHNLAQNQSGQPADILAVRNKQAYLIDCKVCSGGGFALSRIEDNQEMAMKLWKECGNGQGWFAFQLEKYEAWMIPYNILAAYAKHHAVMSPSEIVVCGTRLAEWTNRCK